MTAGGEQGQAIIIAGMHRSGTSALTRVISLLGYDLPSRLLETDPQDKLETNVTGFWEATDVRAINDRFFERLGMRWHSIAPMPKDAFTSQVAAETRASIAAYLLADLKVGSTLLIKDPRISRLLPIWIEALTAANIVPVVLISLRSPLEVARSLYLRNAMRHEYAFLLWMRHYVEAEAMSRDLPRAIVSYEDLTDDWRAASEASLRAANLPVTRAPTDVEAAIENFLRPRSASADSTLGGRAPELVEELYRLLIAGSREGVLDTQAMDRLANDVERADEMYGFFYETSSTVRGVSPISRPPADGINIMDEYEGRRVKESASHKVWFVMSGERRYIPSPEVYAALFDNLDIVELDRLEVIPRGQDLGEGTCLVQGDTRVDIYLVTSSIQTGASRHLIGSIETFADFGFSGSQVRRVPDLLIQALPWGSELQRPASRC